MTNPTPVDEFAGVSEPEALGASLHDRRDQRPSPSHPLRTKNIDPDGSRGGCGRGMGAVPSTLTRINLEAS